MAEVVLATVAVALAMDVVAIHQARRVAIKDVQTTALVRIVAQVQTTAQVQTAVQIIVVDVQTAVMAVKNTAVIEAIAPDIKVVHKVIVLPSHAKSVQAMTVLAIAEVTVQTKMAKC